MLKHVFYITRAWKINLFVNWPAVILGQRNFGAQNDIDRTSHLLITYYVYRNTCFSWKETPLNLHNNHLFHQLEFPLWICSTTAFSSSCDLPSSMSPLLCTYLNHSHNSEFDLDVFFSRKCSQMLQSGSNFLVSLIKSYVLSYQNIHILPWNWSFVSSPTWV